jgi:hypothetical protein
VSVEAVNGKLISEEGGDIVKSLKGTERDRERERESKGQKTNRNKGKEQVDGTY